MFARSRRRDDVGTFAMSDGIIQDPRFARLHNDPRFQRQPKKERKTVVDQRFSAMFKDNSFKDKVAVDKYGRRLPKQKKGKDAELERLYSVAESEAAPAAAARKKPGPKRKVATADPRFQMSAASSEDEDPEEEEEEEFDEEEGGDVGGEEEHEEDRADADEDEGEGETESEGGSTESEDIEDDDDEQEKDSALVQWLEKQHDQVPRVSDATRRLAVCNCNWDQMRAVDILAVVGSFLPPGGRIRSVSVYPSDFGEKQMAAEATVGPSFLQRKVRRGGGGEDEDEDEGVDESDELDESEAQLSKDEARERLRKYELDRLRYYFGVIVCDTPETADHLYKECDGAEFESSSLPLDLRFIPDERKFEKTPRDSCTELPPKYRAPSFMCSALQQHEPTLSWDADDSSRSQTMKRDLSKAEVKELEYAQYLASESEDEDEDDDEGEEEYVFDGPRPPKRGERTGSLAALVESVRMGSRAGGGGRARGGMDGVGADGEGDIAMEMTFDAAELADGSASTAGSRRVAAGKGTGAKRGGEAEEDVLPPTVFEVEEAKRKEKRRAKKQAKQLAQAGGAAGGAAEVDEFADEDEMPAELASDPFFAEALAERAAEEQQERRASTKAIEGGAGAVSAGVASAGVSAGRAKEGKKRSRKDKRAPVLTEAEAAEEARKKAELELLMLGDDADDAREARRGYSLNALTLPAQAGQKGLKGAKRKRAEAAAAAAAMAADEGGFELNLADDRFASVYKSSEFAIDPTDPKVRQPRWAAASHACLVPCLHRLACVALHACLVACLRRLVSVPCGPPLLPACAACTPALPSPSASGMNGLIIFWLPMHPEATILQQLCDPCSFDSRAPITAPTRPLLLALRTGPPSCPPSHFVPSCAHAPSRAVPADRGLRKASERDPEATPKARRLRCTLCRRLFGGATCRGGATCHGQRPVADGPVRQIKGSQVSALLQGEQCGSAHH
jgi:hypothetical protein